MVDVNTAFLFGVGFLAGFPLGAVFIYLIHRYRTGYARLKQHHERMRKCLINMKELHRQDPYLKQIREALGEK